MLLLLTLLACADGATPANSKPAHNAGTGDADDTMAPNPSAADVLLTGGRLAGTEAPVDVWMRSGRVHAVVPGGGTTDATNELRTDALTTIDISGRWLAPAFIDSHVHLAYLTQADDMLRGGVAGAVDLAAPMASIGADVGPMRMLWSGPMLTAVDGYPTQSWGRNGYGLEVTTIAEAEAGVAALADAGAKVIKVPLGDAPELSPTVVTAIVEAAHSRGMRVTTHALHDTAARVAATAGVDVLAHTPVSLLSAGTAEAWSGRAVISSVSAFGGSDDTVQNLGILRAAGVVVLYGTDFGNTRTPRIQEPELALMQAAGMSGAEILAAGTSAPAAWWGFEDLGEISAGKAASLLVLAADPHTNPLTLAAPEQVWIDGVRVDNQR